MFLVSLIAHRRSRIVFKHYVHQGWIAVGQGREVAAAAGGATPSCGKSIASLESLVEKSRHTPGTEHTARISGGRDNRKQVRKNAFQRTICRETIQ
jgi:hypothetical protein